MCPSHHVSSRKRHAFLVSIVILSLSGTHCATDRPQAYQDPRLVEKIESLGGEVYYDYQVAPPGTPARSG